MKMYALADPITISIYNKADVVTVSGSGTNMAIKPKDGAVPVATVTFTLEELVNYSSSLDPNKKVENTNYYNAVYAFANSSKAYMEWSYKAEA